MDRFQDGNAGRTAQPDGALHARTHAGADIIPRVRQRLPVTVTRAHVAAPAATRSAVGRWALLLRASSPVAVGAVAGEAITTEARQLTLQRDHVQPATTDASRLVACLQSVRHATQQPHAMVEAVARLVIVAASSLVAARQGL
jgi:hypothetical protein